MGSIERVCSVPECGKVLTRKGTMCTAHYCRKYRYGDPLAGGKPYQIHGMKGTSEYRSWGSMKDRCLNPKNQRYDDYGARGITVFTEWVDDFMAFYRYVGPRTAPGYTLDRIDNEKGYEPGNVRWATKKEQSNNRRKRRYYAKP